MKRILLISDSHGMIMNLLELQEKVGPVDLVLHMGDVEGNEEHIRSLFAPASVEFVRGNCDSLFCDAPADLVLDLEGHRIYMTHGHRHGVKYGIDEIAQTARKQGADIVLYGHTHLPKLDYLQDMMVINPGSISRPRQPGRQPSYGILELKKGVFPCYCSLACL